MKRYKIKDADLRAAFKDVPDGRYLARDLLPHYRAWARENGRPMTSAHGLAVAMENELCLEKIHVSGHRALWILTRAGLNCRNWFVQPE